MINKFGHFIPCWPFFTLPCWFVSGNPSLYFLLFQWFVTTNNILQTCNQKYRVYILYTMNCQGLQLASQELAMNRVERDWWRKRWTRCRRPVKIIYPYFINTHSCLVCMWLQKFLMEQKAMVLESRAGCAFRDMSHNTASGTNEKQQMVIFF